VTIEFAPQLQKNLGSVIFIIPAQIIWSEDCPRTVVSR